MTEKLKNALLELTGQGRSQKDTVEKYRSHLGDVLKLKNPELTEYLKVFLSIGMCCSLIVLETNACTRLLLINLCLNLLHKI